VSRFPLAALTLTLTTALGCGAKVAVDGAIGTGGSAPAGTCDAACGRVAPACGQDLATCTALCQENAAQAETNGCKEQNDALVTCIVTASDDVVCGAGMDVPASCLALYQAWDACTP
jgi:hypothetical protein